MSGTPKYDWDLLLVKAQRVAQEHELKREIAEELGIPRTTLWGGLRRLFGICTLRELRSYETLDEQTDPEMIDGIRPDKVVKILRKGPVTLRELSNLLDRGEPAVKQVLKKMVEAGYAIEQTQQRVELPDVPTRPKPPLLIREPQAVVKFAVISDLHFGSMWEQPTGLRHFLQEAYEEGVRHVLVAGDWVDGERVYRGQQFEQYSHGAEAQVAALDVRLPRMEGLRYIGIGGNHCYSVFKRTGTCVLALIEQCRDDIVLGSYGVDDVPLCPGIDVRLWHPTGGRPYAFGYRAQKHTEQLAFDELLKVVMGEKPKPTIRMVIVGHLHQAGSFVLGPITVVYGGAWQGQTPYLKQKGWLPQIGGSLVECEIAAGLVQRVSWEWRQYAEIENDYQNYEIPSVAPRPAFDIQPLFSLAEGPQPSR